MIKTILIEDEPASRQALETMVLEFCPELQLSGIAASVDRAEELIKAEQPDLVFLDIELPDGTGFDLLERFPEPTFDIIFTTGYEKYAIRAFKTAAMDYLMKPIDPDELRSAVGRIMSKRKVSRKTDQYKVLMQNLKSGGNEQIALASQEGFLFVKIKDIIYCKGDGAYTYFFLRNEDKVTVSKNIGEFEELLEDYGFFRVHKSYLINLNEMKKYIRGEGGYVVLSNNQTVDVSKRRKEAFMARLARI